ncbi:MAG: imidazole glycerol phosphate synthase subunit HisH [Bacteriovoracaceae bacterium]
MLTVIDYKMINLGSILNMLKKVGATDIVVANRPEQVMNASKIIMPGVGHFDSAINILNQLELIEPLKQKALKEKIPFLGICLGMQLMTKKSEEGTQPGLGFVRAKVKRFNFPSDLNLRVPHMGWNQVDIVKDSKLFTNKDQKRFYFVHSYYVECEDSKDILTTTHHGSVFVSAFEHENLIGAQFHPEKSHNYGLEVFHNFMEKY